MGQAYFLRGYAYFTLARLFGPVPIVNMDPENLPRASAEDMYARIAADFMTAIDLMPNTQLVANIAVNRGRATKWAAEAFLARAFLFYTGYYGEDSMPLAPTEAGAQNGVITKAQVIEKLDDCIKNSGHNLIADFRNLWPYSNEYTKKDGYKYAVDNDLEWIGETGANIETVFALQCRANVTWGYEGGNRINLYFSPREQDEGGIFPFGKGWGFGTVNSRLWNAWSETDIRKRGSIADVNDTTNEMPGFVIGADRQQHETGYIQKKYIAVNVRDEDGSMLGIENANKYVNYSREMYGATVNADYQLNNTQDLVTMRFADVLLMAAELKGPGAGDADLQRVRTRVGLGEVQGGATLENIRQERRFELAFEGVRYYDLLRWGLDYAGQRLNEQNGVEITNAGEDVPGGMSVGNIVARLNETKGLMPIPGREINLSDNVLEQNPGWN
jgi:hypothetical protein